MTSPRKLYEIYLWMSDITSADGKYISWSAERGIRDVNRSSTWTWPAQGYPSKEAWKVWHRGLSLLGSRERSGKFKLFQPLGVWKADCGEWYFNDGTNRILHQPTGNIYAWKIGNVTRSSRRRFVCINQWDETFTKKEVATVIARDSFEEIELEGIGKIRTEAPYRDNTFQHFVQRQHQWKWWASELQYNEEDLPRIVEDIREGRGIAVSDGSFKDQHGTASAVIEGGQYGRRVTSSVIVPGTVNEQCAYRSEAAGILAALQMVHAMLLFYEIK
jgi:hypothetical protein